MLARPGSVLMPDQANVDLVGEDLVDLSSRERVAALRPSGAKRVALGPQATALCLALNDREASTLTAQRKEGAHGLGLRRVNSQDPDRWVGRGGY